MQHHATATKILGYVVLLFCVFLYPPLPYLSPFHPHARSMPPHTEHSVICSRDLLIQHFAPLIRYRYWSFEYCPIPIATNTSTNYRYILILLLDSLKLAVRWKTCSGFLKTGPGVWIGFSDHKGWSDNAMHFFANIGGRSYPNIGSGHL